jgi:ATP-dependent RNA helicase RhlE
VNFELPNVPEDYVHRIGRTARAGGSGSAISLVAPPEVPLVKDIEKLLGHSLPLATLPSYAVNPPRRSAATGPPTPASGGVPHTPVHRAQPRRRGRHPSPPSHGKQSAFRRAPY